LAVTHARAVPAGGQLVCVGGTGAVVGTIVGVGVFAWVGVLPPVGVGVLLVLPPEPQAARRKTRQQPRIVDKKERERTRYIHYLPGSVMFIVENQAFRIEDRRHSHPSQV